MKQNKKPEKELGSHLSEELIKKTGKKSLRVRTGDKVKIMRGDFKNKTGTVEKTLKGRVYITGIERTKKDGSRALSPLHASNLLITEIVKDKRRVENVS